MKKIQPVVKIDSIEEAKLLIINDIKMIIKQKKIKRKVLCKDIKISNTYLSGVFTQKKNPSYDTLIKIVDGIGAKLRVVIEH